MSVSISEPIRRPTAPGFTRLDFQSVDEGATDKKLVLAKRTQEQMQEILRRKQSLSLNLKRALPASPGDQSSSGDEMATSCDIKSFEDANSRKLQIASALSLLPQSVPSSVETMETFHTAAADSPDSPVIFVDADMTQTSDSVAKNREDSRKQEDENESKEDNLTPGRRPAEVDSSEGTTINAGEAPLFITETMTTTSDEEEEEEKKRKNKIDSPTVISAMTESILQDSLESPIQQNPAMKRLNQRIARQRMMVMRCLEASTPSKEDLNRQIMILQDLQKQQIELEVSLLEDERKNQRQQPPPVRCSDGDDRLAIASVGTVDYVQNEPNAYCSVEPTNNSSAILLTVATTRSQLFRNNRPNTNDQETLSETTPPRRSSSRGYSTVYLTVSIVDRASFLSVSFTFSTLAVISIIDTCRCLN